MTTIIGIPGCWKDRSELLESLIRQNLLMAGFVLRDQETGRMIQAETAAHDPEMAEAFFHAGRGMISDRMLERIRNHTYTLYLIFDSSETEDLREVLRLGARVLQAGGLAVKVETAGVAHSRERWLELAQEPDVPGPGLHRAR